MPIRSVDDVHLIGKLISGRYRIEAFIAHTRTGSLYRGEHVLMHKRIAVKVLDRDAAARPEALARFEREAIAGAHVDHPNVAAAKDFGELDDGARFLVVEYLDGPTLRQEIAKAALPLERATHVLRQLAVGLDAAHAKGIVHRSLSPENVFLVRRGGDADVVKVVDFGAAQLPPELVSAVPSAAARPDRIATPVAMASVVAYTSPELTMDGVVDGRSDLFALGVMFYEMLSGKAPMIGPSTPPPELGGSVPVPATLEALARKLVAYDPNQRPASALEVASVLDALGAAARRMSMPSNLEVATGETVLSQATPSLARAAEAGRRDAPLGGGATAARTRVSGQDAEPSGFDLSPSVRARVPSGPLPRPIRVAIGGGSAIVGVIVLAIALRSPLPDEMTGDAPAVASTVASAAGSTSGSARPAAPKATSLAASESPGKLPAMQNEGEAHEVWKEFAKNVTSGRYKDATVGLERLLELDPNAPRDREVRNMTIELAMRIMLVAGDWPTRVYSLITYKMDTVGIDILYELMTTRGGSRGAKLAEELLRSEKIRARGSEALQVAYELRKARSCDDKVALFERAKEHGDGRTFGQLQMLNRDCRRRDPCCLRKDPRLLETIETVRARMER